MEVELKSERRRNALTGEYILVSPQRGARPWLGATESVSPSLLKSYDAFCPLCPGNSRSNNQKNEQYSSVYCFKNDFPALSFCDKANDSLSRQNFDLGSSHLESSGQNVEPNINQRNENALFQSEPVNGECWVVCYSPRHNQTMAQMSIDEIKSVVDLWSSKSQELLTQYEWVQIFENKGELMGCSQPHPHGQVWAQNSVPTEGEKEEFQQNNFMRTQGLSENETSLLLEYAQSEMQKKERVILHNEHWLVVVPYWAKWPFETLVLPLQLAGDFSALNADQKIALAQILQQLTQVYDTLFDCAFPYSMGWHLKPASMSSGWQMHCHFYPPLLRSATIKKHMVGYELLSESQRDITPESAALTLKEITHQLHEKKQRSVNMSGEENRKNASENQKKFLAYFKHQPQVEVQAPGRINIIGEFTDYNSGFALPCALPFYVHVAISQRVDSQVHVYASEYNAFDQFDLTEPITHSNKHWADYIRGVFSVFQSQGYPLKGANIYISGDVPQGSGLSSSAAVEVALAGALNTLFRFGLERVQLAKIGQSAEADFVGCQCGIMDQLISATAVAGHVSFMDCHESSIHQPMDIIPFPSDWSLLVIESGQKRELLGSEYNDRREACEAAADRMNIASLREASVDQLRLCEDLNATERDCAYHVITENERVLAAKSALLQQDFPAMCEILRQGQQSLKEKIKVTVPSIDTLVTLVTDILNAEGANTGACRLSGGGFGGALVCLCRPDMVGKIRQGLDASIYTQRTGLTALVHEVTPSGGYSVKTRTFL